MALTNQERIGKAMDLLRAGLAPFVERELKNAHGERARAEALKLVSEEPNAAQRPLADWDVAALLKVMRNAWTDVFGRSSTSWATGGTTGLTRRRFRATTRTGRSTRWPGS
jgi:hypothetical protein